MSSTDKSKIFLGNKVLGYVSTHVPFVARYIKRRNETLLVTSIGKWFHTYGCNSFRLLSISGEHPGPITCMTADNFHVYTASNNDLFAWRRGCELKHKYVGHEAPVKLMLTLGPHLISIDENNSLKVWDIKEKEQYLELTFDQDNTITTLTHPPTYLNKILLGTEQGNLQLWNLRTAKLIYTFKGWKCNVLVVESAPAIDVVAIGLSNGKIKIHNLKYDETIMEFTHDWGLVSSISFRLDGEPIMVTGSTEGHVVMWNLEDRRIASQMESAHQDTVTGLQCLMSEPLMVSNSGDNSLKLWVFDMPDGGPRLLRIREGHSAPPTVVKHCEPTGENLLSAASDSSLHIMNTVTETFNKSLGKASYRRKTSKRLKRLEEDKLRMPPIVDIGTCMQRDKQWDSIATIHSGLYVGTTWSYNKKKMGENKLKPVGMEKDVAANCLSVTHCGNFVVLGYSNGQVHKFNMQSGIHRGVYGEQKPAHRGAVRGVETDIYNQKVVTVGADDKLKFWYFKSTKLPFKILKLEESVSCTKCHRESGLMALCNENFTITLIDIDNMSIVRKFEGHLGRINDITFDPQSRWLISSSMDCTICTWDIPTSQLVDIFSVDYPCTSISMSPTGDFLATTHVDQIGVFLWANKTLYQKTFLKPVDRDTVSIPKLALPSATVDPKDSMEPDVTTDDDEYKSPEQIHQELITLSKLPSSRWFNLLHLDTIKKKNKPKNQLVVPKSAPFFLPTIPSLEMAFDVSGEKDRFKESKLIPEILTNLSPFAKILSDAKHKDSYKRCFEKLMSLSASMIEVEVLNLAPDAGGSTLLMKQFLIMINNTLKGNMYFEVAQSYLGLFLKLHTRSVTDFDEFKDIFDDIEKTQSAGWSRLQDIFMYNICVVKSFKEM